MKPGQRSLFSLVLESLFLFMFFHRGDNAVIEPCHWLTPHPLESWHTSNDIINSQLWVNSLMEVTSSSKVLSRTTCLVWLKQILVSAACLPPMFNLSLGMDQTTKPTTPRKGLPGSVTDRTSTVLWEQMCDFSRIPPLCSNRALRISLQCFTYVWNPYIPYI